MMHFDPLCWEFLKFWRSWRSLNSKMGKWRKWELNAVHEEKNSLVKKKKRHVVGFTFSCMHQNFPTNSWQYLLTYPLCSHTALLLASNILSSVFLSICLCLSICLSLSDWILFIFSVPPSTHCRTFVYVWGKFFLRSSSRSSSPSIPAWPCPQLTSGSARKKCNCL